MTDRELLLDACYAYEALAGLGGMTDRHRESYKKLCARLNEPEQTNYLQFDGGMHIVCKCNKCKAQLEMTQFNFQEYGPDNWGDSQVTKPEFVAEQKATNEALMKRVMDGIPDMPVKVQDKRFDKFKSFEEFAQSFAQSAQVIGIPKKEWVGLTDEDLETIYEELLRSGGSFNTIALIIEAKLKEKNT